MDNKDIYMVVTPFFPSEESFVGSYVFDQVCEIRRQTGYDVKIIKVTSIFSTERDYEYKGFSVLILKILDFPFFIFPGIFNFINKVRFKRLLNFNNICNIKFAHAHVTYPASYLISHLKCATIVHHHGLDVLQLLNGRNAIIRNLQKRYLIYRSLNHLNRIDLNVGVSRKVLNELVLFKKYNKSKEVVLYNGVDISKFYPLQKKENKIFTIGCIANFWELKDQITLIRSVKILKEKGIHMLVRFIGSGPTLRRCKRYVDKYNLRNQIQFEKEMQHDKLNSFYNSIDLFVLPSYYEALGCVYLESWATNTPFIAVEDQGIAELIPNHLKEHLLIAKSDAIELSNKILNLYHEKLILEFDNKYNLKNTIEQFLNQDIFIK